MAVEQPQNAHKYQHTVLYADEQPLWLCRRLWLLSLHPPPRPFFRQAIRDKHEDMAGLHSVDAADAAGKVDVSRKCGKERHLVRLRPAPAILPRHPDKAGLFV